VGATITYPDGTQLISDAFTLSEINTAFQQIVCGMLGITNPANTSLVRISWPTEGAPFQDTGDDVVYIRCVLKDDPYDKTRYRYNWDQQGYGGPGWGSQPWGGTEGDPYLTEQWNYTRVWTIHLIFYGPNSLDRERAVRSALYQDLFCNQLSQQQLFPVSEFEAGRRVPELVNAQWLERVDFEFDCYEWVTETINRQTVLSVEVFLSWVEVLGFGEIPFGNGPFGEAEIVTETTSFEVEVPA
jgi:hypothetical protein